MARVWWCVCVAGGLDGPMHNICECESENCVTQRPLCVGTPRSTARVRGRFLGVQHFVSRPCACARGVHSRFVARGLRVRARFHFPLVTSTTKKNVLRARGRPASSWNSGFHFDDKAPEPGGAGAGRSGRRPRGRSAPSLGNGGSCRDPQRNKRPRHCRQKLIWGHRARTTAVGWRPHGPGRPQAHWGGVRGARALRGCAGCESRAPFAF